MEMPKEKKNFAIKINANIMQYFIKINIEEKNT